MSENQIWWLKMAVIFAVAVGLWIWLWFQVKKADRQYEASETFQNALIREMEDYNRKHPPKEVEKARSLGFLDEKQYVWEDNAFALDEDSQPHSDPPRAA